ncbi:CAF17-like 4Fe-4S cluster assembly/insertion protein YgfZ [Rhodopirellula halodulae]|uniref:CAF17-like 4Fe-4S cluster assembly/insertion protein YgfZ n=1 Tax=Rhodopirellula halodulae TaxID=2894198 RepID=UPI001E4F5788|nr:aminomethyltransferase [Rhodopirellula sp. JC737]MCC9654986.1 aminomethyltransferase [Rhodopirellula sp. JC737]
MALTSYLIRLPSLCVLDLVGEDATAILHNLTTNQIKSLTAEGETRDGVETFITNVRGKCLGHVFAFAIENGFRLIGAPGISGETDGQRQSTAIAEHADRYTIREDATPMIRDDDFAAWVMLESGDTSLSGADNSVQPTTKPTMTCDDGVDAYQLPWVPAGTLYLLPSDSEDHVDTIAAAMSAEAAEFAVGDEVMFHQHRIAAGFPWYGVDLTDAHLPQEADREKQTISFTKGCYLGQETVARLDALGQVQKKLVRWRLQGVSPSAKPSADDKLFAEDAAADAKPVGRITSVGEVNENGVGMAMGYARRSHFDAGSVMVGKVGDVSYTAEVLPPIVGESPE